MIWSEEPEAAFQTQVGKRNIDRTHDDLFFHHASSAISLLQ